MPFVAAMGAVTSKVVWWESACLAKAGLKRDPDTPNAVFG